MLVHSYDGDRVDHLAVDALRTYFDAFWAQALDAFRADAEAADD